MMISAEMYADGLVLADIVTELLVRHLAGESIEFEQSLGSLGSPIVQQSVGILAERYGVEVAEAQVRLRAMAFRRGSTVVELAQRIVNREVIEEQDS
jgi:AmiR/NasT family two-component response regulator